MRINRVGEFRRKVIEISTKVAMIFITALFVLWMISGARADVVRITSVKHSVDSGVREVSIQFNEALAKNQVSIEHQRNFIQISLRGASAYPANTTNVNDGLLDKIFTYQYQPDLARARILLNTDSEKFKSSTTWSLDGKRLLVRFGGTGDAISLKNAAPERDVSQEANDRIVKEILSGKVAQKTNSLAKGEDKTAPVVAIANVEDEPLFTGKAIGGKVQKPADTTTRSAARMISALLTVLLLIAGSFLGYRRLRGRAGKRNHGSGRAMETILSHALGNKRSLSLVRIANKYYVLGVTDHNISVVTSFDNDADIEKYLDEINTGSGFETMLAGKLNIFGRKEEAAEAWEQSSHALEVPATRPSIRESIKKRIEGFKPLY